ncbi:MULTISPECIES: FAD-dependent monooxygenase [unclassified Arthrobacter]|uniref:FAD-dependent monooxygenase n=1 Tax=unclassified Arthrobacter TaxID=235627 RepID=UPI001E45BCEA|nr:MULTISPECIES: FAD-dependent monooxygenase [unclassified Arthrobacter]MCC9145866.1 FAD-dependent monooxygenase [Arthrobacter sp. zg-Y919]MDK1277095.1 FAD-dependent monooxygenase [Arthrobacter sp. zg.Y919]WIB03619.1 FAD-dependent monooxygenase [Arthrobacter sp. zg-Y919]
MAAHDNSEDPNYDVDVLIVGAGPTGLALAAQLAAFGASFRIIDRRQTPGTESRAIAIQPRTLEALRPFGISGELVSAGRPARELHLHLPEETLEVDLFDTGLEDSAFQQLLFLSQTETERILTQHLLSRRVRIERGAELQDLERLDPEDPFAGMEAKIQRMDRGIERIRARYVVGADGAESTVRAKAGMDWRGGAYPETFILADVEIEGAEPDAVHSYPTEDGFLFLFPLGGTATWRMISIKPPHKPANLETLQGLADTFAHGALKVHDPRWISTFRLSHQMAEYFQRGSVFLAGDAAHVHSPVAAQGMNTGIQDALNLGWKLALGARGLASDELVDSYHAERRPVDQEVVSSTDRIFRLATSRNGLKKLPRTKLLPALAPKAMGWDGLRARLFRTMAQLNVNYRGSSIVESGPSHRPALLASGPQPGDRLPDADVIYQDRERRLQDLVSMPGFSVLLTGPGWPQDAVPQLHAALPGLAGLLNVQYLTVGSSLIANAPGIIKDVSGLAFHRLGLSSRRAELLVIRPDGYVGYRSSGRDITGAVDYLQRLTSGPAAGV